MHIENLKRFLLRFLVTIALGLGFVRAELSETAITGTISEHDQPLNDCLNTYLPDSWFFYLNDNAVLEGFLHGRFDNLEPEFQKLFLLTMPYTSDTNLFELFSRADLSISVVLSDLDANDAVTDFLTHVLEDDGDEVCHELLRTHYRTAVINVNSQADTVTISILTSVIIPTEMPHYHTNDHQFYSLPWKY